MMHFMDDKTVNNIVIPHSRPFLGEEEAVCAAAVIRSGHIAQGEQVAAFEAEFCRRLGQGRGAAVASGTAALYLAIRAVGVGPGHEVIIPSFVCTALLHAVRYAGAAPVIADVDPLTGNMDPADAKKRISAKTRAIVVAHMFGLPADMDALLETGIPLIEDCAQAVGAQWRGKPIGVFGSAAVFSFYATKVMTTGEGGMVTSQIPELIDGVRDLRDYDRKETDGRRFNFKMTDIQASVGRAQLKRLDFVLSRRQEIAMHYSNAFKGCDAHLPPDDPGRIYFRYIFGLDSSDDPGRWFRSLRKAGIGCEKPVYRPIHEYLNLKGYPGTREAHRRFISLPIYPAMTQREIDRVTGVILETHEGLRGV